VRCRRARLIVEDCGEGLEPAADVAQGLAVAGEVLRLLPCLLGPSSACDTPLLAARLPGLGCIAVGSVPDAAEGCLVRLASSGRSRRGASPTAAVSDARTLVGQRTKSIETCNRPASGPCTWGMQGTTACGRVAFRVPVAQASKLRPLHPSSSQPSKNARHAPLTTTGITFDRPPWLF
jgi:hypothetical protein